MKKIKDMRATVESIGGMHKHETPSGFMHYMRMVEVVDGDGKIINALAWGGFAFLETGTWSG